jgi:hypothetical protein
MQLIIFGQIGSNVPGEVILWSPSILAPPFTQSLGDAYLARSPVSSTLQINSEGCFCELTLTALGADLEAIGIHRVQRLLPTRHGSAQLAQVQRQVTARIVLVSPRRRRIVSQAPALEPVISDGALGIGRAVALNDVRHRVELLHRQHELKLGVDANWTE